MHSGGFRSPLIIEVFSSGRLAGISRLPHTFVILNMLLYTITEKIEKGLLLQYLSNPV